MKTFIYTCVFSIDNSYLSYDTTMRCDDRPTHNTIPINVWLARRFGSPPFVLTIRKILTLVVDFFVFTAPMNSRMDGQSGRYTMHVGKQAAASLFTGCLCMHLLTAFICGVIFKCTYFVLNNEDEKDDGNERCILEWIMEFITFSIDKIKRKLVRLNTVSMSK